MLEVEFDHSVWDHRSGTESGLFVIGPIRRIAVKVIEEQGNELMGVLEVD